jgi:hypothetical protein
MDLSLPSSFQHRLHTMSLPCFASDPMSSHRRLGGAGAISYALFVTGIFDLYGRVQGKEQRAGWEQDS